VSHEIRQPVAVVLALAEAARALPELPESGAWYLDRIIDEVITLGEAARSALAVEGDVRPRAESVEVVGLVDDVLASFELTWDGAITREGVERGSVVGDPVLVRRALVNLLDNAVRAAGSDGRVIVSVRVVGRSLVLTVEDDGPGFGLIERQTNLGLAVAEQAFAHSRGTLTVGSSSRLGGAAVTMSIPSDGAGKDGLRASRAV
jgi:signal transduction histidine kinase